MISPIALIKSAPANLIKFIQERIAKIDVFDETKVDLQKDSPWYQLGGMYYLAWMIVIGTGLFLVSCYIPTTSQAFDSIHVIKDHVFLGALLRGMHKYGGDAMIIAATLKVYRMWFTAEYKNKGEFAFIIALLLLVAAMYSGLTGYLLIWNQRAFWATKVFATFPTYLDVTPTHWHWPWEFKANDNTWLIPNMIGAVTKIAGNLTHQGMTTSQILMGGSSIGQATMTRFYSLHFGISLIMLVATELYFYKNRFNRLNLKWPARLALIAIIAIIAIIVPSETGSRANPEVTPLPILSDWYFLALYQMLKYMDPYWATIWTLGIPVTTIVLMFLDFGPERSPWKRPIFTVIAVMALIEFVIFSLLILANQANLDRDPPYWFAHLITSVTVGQLWHWSMYRQKLPMGLWVLFNLAISSWYLYFWHALAGKGVAFQNLFATLQGQVVDWNPANLYWNLLWLAFSVIQALIFGGLMVADYRAKEAEEADGLQQGLITGVTA
jgi:quinol-cytochrome oxidoreductase complex cytochrome b subunit